MPTTTDEKAPAEKLTEAPLDVEAAWRAAAGVNPELAFVALRPVGVDVALDHAFCQALTFRSLVTEQALAAARAFDRDELEAVIATQAKRIEQLERELGEARDTDGLWIAFREMTPELASFLTTQGVAWEPQSDSGPNMRVTKLGQVRAAARRVGSGEVAVPANVRDELHRQVAAAEMRVSQGQPITLRAKFGAAFP